MHDVRAAHRIRVQIERFSGNLSRCLPEVGQRLVREVLYGVQARGSVRLSEIARSLGERTALKKVIERLDRQLGRPGLRERVRKNLLREAAPFVGQDILLVIDPTDVTKPTRGRCSTWPRSGTALKVSSPPGTGASPWSPFIGARQAHGSC